MRRSFLAALAILAHTSPINSVAASFTPLGDLAGGDFQSAAYGISADGKTVVGVSSSASGNEAFRWTISDGMLGLGDLDGGKFHSMAMAVSADGSVVVGQGNNAFGTEPYRWTVDGGMEGLGDLPGGGFITGNALGVSADGSVVVGQSDSSSGGEAYRWTIEGGMIGLGDLEGGIFESSAQGISADGAVIVGIGVTAANNREALRWTSVNGMVGLGDLPGGEFFSRARRASADGSVVVGDSRSAASGLEAFRWAAGDGMVGLGDFAGGDFVSLAYGVSADGSTVVGRGESASGTEAFVWTQANGMENLRDVLMERGAAGLANWTLSEAWDISANGQWIVGFGINPDGNREAFLANIGVPIFNDVPSDYWAITYIEALAASKITAGCGNDNYCPGDSVTRSQMAVFLERGMNGSDFVPPAASGNVFLDVAAGDFAANFIEQLYADGVTAGCGNNNYCPNDAVTRAQMAVFLLRAKYGSSYSPPAATGVFGDVDLSHWAVHWIEQLAAEGITAGCGNNNFCPTDPVTRDQMAVFLVRTFGL